MKKGTEKNKEKKVMNLSEFYSRSVSEKRPKTTGIFRPPTAKETTQALQRTQ